MTKSSELDYLIQTMQGVYQAPGQDVLQHGIAVMENYIQLWLMLKYGVPNYKQFELPGWFEEYRMELLLGLPDLKTAIEYLTFHDCGKPAVQYIDDNNVVHYPEHEVRSAMIWKTLRGPSDVVNLMRADMDAHRASTDVKDFVLGNDYPACLLLAAIASIHANAVAFGGVGEKPFNTKLLHLSQFGWAVCREMFGEKNT